MRRVVVIIGGVMAALIAGLAWSISSPPGSSPDEDFHLASIWCPPPVQSSGCSLAQDPKEGTEVVLDRRVVAISICYAYHPEISGSCIGNVDGTAATFRYDKGDYPGGYYHVMHLFAGGSDPFLDVYIMRAVNVALAVGLGTAVILCAPLPTRRILGYVVASTYVPMGMFITASVNPSSWALTGVTTAAFALHSFWQSETRKGVWANGLLFALGAAVAASARSDAGLYLLLAAIALSVLHYRQVRRKPLRLWLPLAAVVVGVIVFRMGAQTTSALTGSGFGREDGNTAHWSDGFSENLLALPHLLMGNTGNGNWGLGWLDTPVPPVASSFMVFVGAFVIMSGLSRLPWVKTLVLIGGVTVLVALPMYMLTAAHVQVGNQVQPRYLLPLLPVIGLVLLTGGTPDHAVRLPRQVAWLSWAMVSVANGVSLMTNIRRYTTGLDGPLLPGRQIEWWTPHVPGPRITWVIGSLAFAAVAFWIVRLTVLRDTPAVSAHVRTELSPGSAPMALATPVWSAQESAERGSEHEVGGRAPDAPPAEATNTNTNTNTNTTSLDPR